MAKYDGYSRQEKHRKSRDIHKTMEILVSFKSIKIREN